MGKHIRIWAHPLFFLNLILQAHVHITARIRYEEDLWHKMIFNVLQYVVYGVESHWLYVQVELTSNYMEMVMPYLHYQTCDDWGNCTPSNGLPKKCMLRSEYIRYLRKTITIIFCYLPATKQAKFHFSSTIIDRVSLLGYTIYFSVEVHWWQYILISI